MSLMNNIKDALGIEVLKNAVFLKDYSDLEKQKQDMIALQEKIIPSKKKEFQQDLKCIEYGIMGENAVEYELRNSHIPMYVLHDLFLEKDGLTAQIDFLLVTKKIVILIECKNLYGDIEISNDGEFIRKIGTKREGIYSPITQLERHLNLLREIQKDSKSNFLTKTLFEKYFDDNYKSVVVLANTKTVKNSKYVKKEIRDKVIRCDQLSAYIKTLLSESKNENYSDKEMENLARQFLGYHKENKVDYLKKYYTWLSDKSDNSAQENILCQAAESDAAGQEKEVQIKEESIEELKVYQELKKYRLEKSRQEKLKPYMIFNNEQLAALIQRYPSSEAELKKVPGFGEVKCQKYGSEILMILKQNRDV